MMDLTNMEKKVEELRGWLDNQPIDSGVGGDSLRTRRLLLRMCEPSLLSEAVLKILDVIAPKKS